MQLCWYGCTQKLREEHMYKRIQTDPRCRPMHARGRRQLERSVSAVVSVAFDSDHENTWVTSQFPPDPPDSAGFRQHAGALLQAV